MLVGAYLHPANAVARGTHVRVCRRVIDAYSARPTLSIRARRQRAISTSRFVYKPTYHQSGRGSLLNTWEKCRPNLSATNMAQLKACKALGGLNVTLNPSLITGTLHPLPLPKNQLCPQWAHPLMLGQTPHGPERAVQSATRDYTFARAVRGRRDGGDRASTEWS